MVQQTLGDQPAGGNAARRVARSTSHIAHNLFSLAELQGRLLMADLRASQRDLKFCGLLLVIGGVAFLASLPLALIATAHALMAWGMSDVGAHFAAAGIGLLVAAIAIPLAWSYFRHSLDVFQRSASEFQRNVECLQDMLRPDDSE
jgi:hypothetical protein